MLLMDFTSDSKAVSCIKERYGRKGWAKAVHAHGLVTLS